MNYKDQYFIHIGAFCDEINFSLGYLGHVLMSLKLNFRGEICHFKVALRRKEQICTNYIDDYEMSYSSAKTRQVRQLLCFVWQLGCRPGWRPAGASTAAARSAVSRPPSWRRTTDCAGTAGTAARLLVS